MIVVAPTSPAGEAPVPARTIALPALPEPAAPGSGLALGLMGTLGSVGMLGFAGSAGPWVLALIGAGTAAGLVAAVARARELRRRRRAVEDRRVRWSVLARAAADEAASAAERHRAGVVSRHPGDAGLLARADGSEPGRFWSTGWTVRIGLGPEPAPVVVEVGPQDPLGPPDPLVQECLLAAPRIVPGCPVLAEVMTGGALVLSRGQARRAVAELAVARDPSGWALLAAVSEGWDALGWLPPAWDPERPGATRCAEDLAGLRSLLREAPPERLVLLDHPDGALWARALPAERVVVVDARGRNPGMSEADLTVLARRLAPLGTGGRPAPRRGTGLADLRRDGPAPAPLTVPIGRDVVGAVLTLDLREAAAGGQGPHGLVVGATGSGKSELLRALVGQLAHTHTPDELALLLVDHKGGTAFAGLAVLPHVAGLATNLGDVAEGPGGPARLRASLGGELDPDLLGVLVRVGRLGRSLGVHLVLATQRLEEGRLRGLEAHLRWRVCLRTFSESESRAAIGVPDAAHLPPVPGPALLSVDGRLQRFEAAWSDGPAHRSPVPPVRPLAWSVGPGEIRTGPTEREAVVADVLARGQGATHPVCLPPLRPLLDEAPSGAVVQLDLPAVQAQPWVAPVWADGHLAVVGAPRSGRSTALLACAQGLLAQDPDARLVLVGADLRAWAGAPAVWAAADLSDVEHLQEVLRACLDVLDRPCGEPPVLVLVDGVAAVRAELADELVRLAERGPARGVHLVVAGHRWSDLGPLRDLISQRWELGLADPLDSHHGPALAALLRGAPPGRLLDAAGRLGQVVWPGPPPRHHARRGTRPPPGLVLRPLPAEAPVLGADVLGIRAGDHAPVRWEPTEGPLVVLGGPGSGRSSVLRRLLHGLPDAVWLTDGALPEGGVVLVDDSERRPGVVAQLMERGAAFVVVRAVSTSGRSAWDPDLTLLRDRAGAVLVLSGDPHEGPLVRGIVARPGGPGRGTWAGRGSAPVSIRTAAPGPHLRVAA